MTDCCLHYVGEADRRIWSHRHVEAGRRVEAYLARCADVVRDTFAAPRQRPADIGATDVDGILRVLLTRTFNYQANGRVAHLLPTLRARIAQGVRGGRPLSVSLLYNGGYRASLDALHDLVFTPDATELLLLFQVARLQRALAAVHPPGVSFGIVINNGVAAHTNDIALAQTERYVAGLRDMIRDLGADAAIAVVVQSELGAGEAVRPTGALPIDAADHRIVERFLGRACSIAEAQERASVYLAAERAWAVDIARVVDATSGIAMRQVAHPACLSFRPFPGGAIRVQNGSIGFRLRDGDHDPVPFLVTSNTLPRGDILTVPVRSAVFLGQASRMDAAA